LAAFYPLVFRDDWNQQSVIDAVAQIANSLGFANTKTDSDTDWADPERTTAEIVRDYRITDSSALARLDSQRPQLSRSYDRLAYYWSGDHGEITLVICDANLTPFAAPGVRKTGDIWFACGFVDIFMPDGDIERLGLDERMATLPLLYVPE